MQNINKYTGNTLLEVLISLFLINTILFSLIKSELLIWHKSAITYSKAIAAIQVSNLFELLKLKKQYASSITTLIDNWEKETKKLLPKSNAQYNCNSNQCDISLQWQLNKIEKINVKRDYVQ